MSAEVNVSKIFTHLQAIKNVFLQLLKKIFFRNKNATNKTHTINFYGHPDLKIGNNGSLSRYVFVTNFKAQRSFFIKLDPYGLTAKRI